MLTKKNIALNFYSFGYYGGLIKDQTRQRPLLDLDELVTLVEEYNLGGIEIPFDRFFGKDKIQDGVAYLKNIKESGLSVFLDLEETNSAYIKLLLPFLTQLDVNVVRIKMDQIGRTIYGGNRYLSDSFGEAVNIFKSQLQDLVPDLKKYNVSLAIENHQDFHSSELKKLIEQISPEHLGITWDIGNSSSVCDSPASFYETLEPYIRNVHLKDYSLMRSEKGIKLVRCAFGDGYVDYGLILPKLLTNHRIVNMSIELGAQITRECDLNVENYWSAFKGVDIDKDRFLDFVGRNVMEQSKSDLSHYEMGLNEKAMIESELDDIDVSIRNLNYLLTEN